MAIESGTSVRGSYINLQALQNAREDSEDEVAELASIHPLTILKIYHLKNKLEDRLNDTSWCVIVLY